MAGFPPRTNAELLAASANVVARISGAGGAIYQLSSQQITDYVALHDAYAAAYQTAYDPITRTRASVLLRNEKRDALLIALRSLGGMVQANTAVPEDAKVNLGLHPRKHPTPPRIPGQARIDIVSVNGTTVAIHVHGDGPSRRGRPEYADGVTILSYTGDTPPVDPLDWRFEGSFGKMKIEIGFPLDTPMGTQVHLTGFFFNARKESGPAATPVSTHLMGSTVAAKAA